MLTVEDYRARVVALARPLPVHRCEIGRGWGRTLEEDVVARFPVPPFSNSAMDGFAVRAEDITADPTFLRVIGDIPAGAASAPEIGPGQAARIMTGAPLPVGANAVVPVENTDQEQGDVPLSERVAVSPVPLGKNVRFAGEDVAEGEVVLQRGAVWSPACAGAAASVGYASVLLRCAPKVAIVATGSELVDPGQPLAFGQIPDSNSILLRGLVERWGGEVVLARSVSDVREEFWATLMEASYRGADVIITSGAVSVGAFEVVRQVLGDSVDFVKVAMQPGKPQASGRVTIAGRDVALVGLPGNPVSVFVSAWVYIRPLLAAFQGQEAKWSTVQFRAAEGWRTPPGRTQYLPAVVTNAGVQRSHRLGSGSHLIASLHRAQALAVVPAEVEEVRPGDLLTVHMLY